MGVTDQATGRQVKLIEGLYADLRIRNTSLYGGASPAQLTKQRASEVIDVLTLRKLSGQLGRPVAADLSDPAQVREQLVRLEQLTDGHHARHVAAVATRAEHLSKASEISDVAVRQATQAAAPRVRALPHVREHEKPQPRAGLTAEQLAARAAELDHVREPRLDAASRYSDVTGYGSGASYRGAELRSSRDAPELSDGQERKIIELQAAGDDTAVSNTVVEASEYLDRALAPPGPLPPTERQLGYLHKLERDAGKTDEQLSHPGTRQGASRRIQFYLDAASQREAATVDDELATAMALTAEASPHPIREVVDLAPDVATEVTYRESPLVDHGHDQDARGAR
jgi:hypothetical protein